MNTIKFKDCLELNIALGACLNKGLEVSTILSLIDFKDELETNVEKYRKALKDIMASYNIPEINGNFSWADNENKTEISQKISELLDNEVQMNSTNTISDDEIVKLTEGMNLSNVLYLRKFLRKSNNTNSTKEKKTRK